MKTGEVISIKPEGLFWNEEAKAIIGELDGIRIILPKEEIRLQNFKWGLSRFPEIVIRIVDEGFSAIVQSINEEQTEAIVSIKELQKRTYQNIREGKIYVGTIEKIGNRSIYINVNGIKVRVYLLECSRAKVENLQKIFHVGEISKVKILEKDDEFPYHIQGSRKQAYSRLVKECYKYEVGQEILVTVCERLNYDGFWIEVTPGIPGILNVTEEQANKIKTGDKLVALITRIDLERGLKCRLKE